ncbi:hypothetical protein A5641_24785 [Mycobacterium sp. 1554424.7]|nr:hypothetical protein A5641_24785 [Mycobacterium sp. 1554424.7]
MLVGLLGGLQIAARGFALLLGRAPVGGHVAEALLDRELLDFGGAFVGGAGLVVAMHRAFPGGLVPLVGAVGALGRALDVVLMDLWAASSAPRRSSSWARWPASWPGESAVQ